MLIGIFAMRLRRHGISAQYLVALPTIAESQKEESILDVVVQKQLFWHNTPILRGKIRDWADSHPDVMIMDEYGPVLACPLPESR